MNETSIAVMGTKQALLSHIRNLAAMVASFVLAAARHGRGLIRRSAVSAVAAYRTLRGTKLLLGDHEYSRTIDCLRQFEAQSLAIALHLGSPEKKLRACLDIGRTTQAFGRDTGAVLVAALNILKDREYWIRKQNRVFAVVQMACALARLAAKSGQTALGSDIYLWAQQYNALVIDVDRRIGLAVALSDVAACLRAGCDQAAWLTTAMEMASGIRGDKLRLGAVNYVAHKMVLAGIPPQGNPKEERRFSIVEEPTLEAAPSEPAPLPVAASADDDIKFDLI